MKLNSFITTLLPSFSKEMLREDLECLRKELKESTMPPYELSKKEFGKRKFKATWVENFHSQMKSDVQRISFVNFIAPVHQCLLNIDERLPMLERMVDKYYEEDIVKDAMNLKRFNTLHYMEAVSFFLRYSRRLVNMAFALEINACSEDVSDEMEDILPFDLQWLNRGRSSYFQVMQILLDKKLDFEAAVNDLPDINVNMNNAKVVETTKGRDADPANLGLIPLVLNPIYHIGMAVAEWQVSRLRAAQDEEEILKVRVYNLKLIDQGRNDAKLQRQVNYIETKRLRPLQKKIAEMEKDYA